MIRITLEQWRMFKAVVDFGGFNQAAQNIHKSQSSIHSSVSKIEQSLGLKLFYIEGKKTHLTDSGVLLLRRANYLLEEAEKLESIGHILSEGIESQLKIAVDEMFPQDRLCEALELTSMAFPFLRVEILESVLSGANELLEKGSVDLAISSINNTSGSSEAICQIEFIAVTSPDHPLQQNTQPISHEELKLHRQIVIRDSALTQSKDAGWLGAHQRWTVSHIRTSLDMLSRGLGFAWLPVTSIQTALQQNTITPLALKRGSSRLVSLHLLYKDDDMLGPATQFFVEKLREQCLKI
ncbi:LysR family transcriptional regulator [Psychrosphaera sp. 1_MG-2023]|uniref:LysR family transcriptional regulator n=1 Tax=Psychrosphaera sp. 1_MG-2023 TaxID=3062643 RepID=UPI0026E2EDAD|nr:LysR family transcriptional regulator [Psychrosphaera sp. 1_MG-2023]MDO6720723.1 LysR family transcriptional regulator [Psychrosphaera sp. 1_MG-2023]